MTRTPIAQLPIARPALIDSLSYDLFTTSSGNRHRVAGGVLACSPNKPRPNRGALRPHLGGPEVVISDGREFRTGLTEATCHRCNRVNWR